MENNQIPEMTDPLGRHWRQPSDMREVPMDGEVVLLTRRQFDELADYSRSMPSGVYEGKCWRRSQVHPATGEIVEWWLLWYGPCDQPGYVETCRRRIEVVE